MMFVGLEIAVRECRRMGVRAQFGEALCTLPKLLGRIGIRPPFCYRVPCFEAGGVA